MQSNLPKKEDILKNLTQDATIAQLVETQKFIYYLSEEKTVCRYDTSTKETTELYVSTESIPYYIPFADLGVMIGTQAPTDAQGNAHTALAYKENLTWDGEYYYYKAEGEAPILVEDPDWFLFAAASNFTSLPNFKTTINGKAIPHSKYAHGSTYNNNDFSGATQCEGFAKYIYQYLFGSAYSGTKTDVKERITGATYVKNKLSNLPLGSIIRTDKTGAYQSNTGRTRVIVLFAYQQFTAGGLFETQGVTP